MTTHHSAEPPDRPDSSDAVVIYGGFHLLDRQVFGSDGRMVCKVDDVELDADGDEPPRVTAVHVGAVAVGTRYGGRLGTWIVAIAERLRAHRFAGPARFPFTLVDRIENALTLSVPAHEVGVDELELWVREHLTKRIPGGQHAP